MEGTDDDEVKTITFDVEGVSPTINVKQQNGKGKIKVLDCMDEFLGSDRCGMSKFHISD